MINAPDLYNQFHYLFAFEGFEMTGKSFYMRKFCKELENSDEDITPVIYRPNWERNIPDNVIKRGNRYLIGLGACELFSQIEDTHMVMLLDRWVASSYVYMVLMQQESDCDSLESMIKSAKLCSEKLNPIFIHKYHSTKAEAMKMYDISTSDKDHEDAYDNFDSFDDYWRKYSTFEEIFDKFYKISGFPVIKISSYYGEVRRN